MYWWQRECIVRYIPPVTTANCPEEIITIEDAEQQNSLETLNVSDGKRECDEVPSTNNNANEVTNQEIRAESTSV